MKLAQYALAVVLLLAGAAAAQAPVARSTGQMLYLPIYSHVWHGDLDSRGEPAKALVSVSVSIRNTDPARAIRVLSAQYYDTDGKRLREYVVAPRIVQPMATFELFIPRKDDTGGSGANFVIVWKADVLTSPPIVEGFHANMPVGRSIAFTTTARPIPSE